jgi:hypothetical protein
VVPADSQRDVPFAGEYQWICIDKLYYSIPGAGGATKCFDTPYEMRIGDGVAFTPALGEIVRVSSGRVTFTNLHPTLDMSVVFSHGAGDIPDRIGCDCPSRFFGDDNGNVTSWGIENVGRCIVPKMPYGQLMIADSRGAAGTYDLLVPPVALTNGYSFNITSLSVCPRTGNYNLIFVSCWNGFGAFTRFYNAWLASGQSTNIAFPVPIRAYPRAGGLPTIQWTLSANNACDIALVGYRE